jgi:ubiquinone/menaquinone biosynthesis C-methylase UbiE
LSGKVLDFGAGDCNLISLIDSQAGLQGHGIDIRDYRQVPDFKNFSVYDGRRIPFPDAFFDTVVSVYVVHHVRDQGSAIGEIARVLKPGGVLVLIEDSFESPLGRVVAAAYDLLANAAAFQVTVELNFHTPSDWKQLLENDHSLRVQQMTPLRLGPICRIVPPSLYFKLLLIARKSGSPV